MRNITSGIILLITILILSASSGHAFEFNGFADINFKKSTEGVLAAARNGSFALGAMDLYFAGTLEDIDIMTELLVSEGRISVHRLNIGYTFSDALRFRVGRFHAPLGLWNTSYHHGQQLQPTIERPEIIKFDFENGVLPLHVVGGYLSGRVLTTAGTVEYGASIDNGPTINTSNRLAPNNTSDNNNGKGILLHVALSPDMVEGFKAGVSGYKSRIQGAPSSVVDVDLTVLGAALNYSTANIDLATEYFSIKNEDNSTATNAGSNTSNGYFVLARYIFKDKWIPYLLYDKISIKAEDPYFDKLGTQDVTKTTVGFRYNINYRSCIKGEIRSVERGTNDWSEYGVQWALAF